MNHFSLKSLTFYGVAIGSVVLLFKVVTAYGETNLKAPAPINGSYTINAKTLPGCLKSDALVLIIQQSGIYLNGSLLPVQKGKNSQETGEEKLSLTGKWNKKNPNQPLTLSGAVPDITKCQNQSVVIQGLADGKILKGRIKESSNPQVVEFTAKREATEQKKEKSGGAHN